MPALKNQRHERFALLLASGKTSDEAYQQAGYTENRGNAARLKATENIQSRVRELHQQHAAVNGVDVERVTKMLLADRDLARELGQVAAAVKASESLGRLHGLYVDRKDINITSLRELTPEQIDTFLAELDPPSTGTAARGSTH